MGLQRSSFSSPLPSLARWESFPSGTFPWALLSLAANLIIFSLGWQNTNQLSHASASYRHNAAERKFGRLIRKPHLPQLPGAVPQASLRDGADTANTS